MTSENYQLRITNYEKRELHFLQQRGTHLKSGNVVQDKSYAFALRIVNVYRHLSEKKREFVLSKQILESGTSIGANIEEAIGAQSTKDFLAKIAIAYKEGRETHFWLRLLRDSDYLTVKQAASLLEDCEELLRLLGSIQKTMKGKKNA